jgi:protein TonB
VNVYSQDRFYAYKQDWSNTTDLKEAVYFMHVVKEDSSYVCRYYNFTGPMIKMESFRDPDLSIPQGRFAWYNAKGKLDSTGFIVENGRKDGTWLYFTQPDSPNATIIERFDNGKFQSRQEVLNKRTVYKDGRIVTYEQEEKADTGLVVQVEAAFPGGMMGWKRYLEKSLNIPERFEQIVRGNGRATVVVAFKVDKTGSISDVYLHKSVEWSADTEAQRVIKKGPKWIPATQDGKNVPFRQRQSITIVVQE